MFEDSAGKDEIAVLCIGGVELFAAYEGNISPSAKAWTGIIVDQNDINVPCAVAQQELRNGQR
jgi:hypothetical protein